MTANPTPPFQSTPSARRATITRQSHRTGSEISIHALREEGDGRSSVHDYAEDISIHALREEGDEGDLAGVHQSAISIHALREEGDHQRQRRARHVLHFNPRPPRGGRHFMQRRISRWQTFQSTPSARRATAGQSCTAPAARDFNPRPPRGGRRTGTCLGCRRTEISIHALREEGDRIRRYVFEALAAISIHALREEGDLRLSETSLEINDFNPRPPRGGRREKPEKEQDTRQFQSTPSARRATYILCTFTIIHDYFNPRPPRGGRRKVKCDHTLHTSHFNPRPPRGGRRKH